MKRILVALTVLLSFASLSGFASEKVNARVLESFKNEFKNATEVGWTVTGDFYKANFTMNGQYVSAYYDEEGDLVALTRNITTSQLPISLQANLKKNYEGFWVSDLFEVSKNGETSYYITLEDADTKIVLKSSGSDWTGFQKQRKS